MRKPKSLIRDAVKIVEITGVPVSHQDAFQEVADKANTVIMSRAVGHLCTTLIEEGYASKGFHIKAKSCNFGPMAGFVLEDPKLTKNKDTEGQRKSIRDALTKHHATSAPVAISERRRLELVRLAMISVVSKEGENYVVKANETSVDDEGSIRASFSGYQFRLIRLSAEDLAGQNAPSSEMYAIEYFLPWQAQHVDPIRSSRRNLVHGMVNPTGLGGTAAGIRATVCGDYDLFSTAVSAAQYDAGGVDATTREPIRGMDSRMVPINDVSAAINRLKNGIDGPRDDLREDVHLGNMTGRLRQIRNLLNDAFRAKGYVGGNMVHHSDEAGRPLVDDVDLPVFAVVPGQTMPFALCSIPDLREFLHLWIGRDYVISSNPAWERWITGSRVFASELHQKVRSG